MNQSLQATLDRTMAILHEGASDLHSAWRNVTLATLTATLKPNIRTLVLRGFDTDRRALELHTDSRSRKHAELLANPAAALHAWNPATAEQIRVEGSIVMHAGDSIARAAWQKLGSRTRDTYRVTHPPGEPIPSPTTPAHTLDDDAAFAVFAVLSLNVARVEYLLIAESGHRRAAFTWAHGTPEAMWLVP